MIRIDSIWLATQPMDMRAGTDTALARVVAVFGAAKPHCAYLFANRRATRAAKSSTCTSRIKASWLSRRFTRLAGCTKSSDTLRK
ncbi:IS66 family insertion sequence element accessory protein TnpB [Pseudomonas edaphica]|uniref:IS66 family insertion sequence element accessory protein TnpB n=1 Tax=Pseudomonas edaphica TaxID=2006980 RepID=A0A7Y8E2M9_9PSED|nr:IS66 family insertion sequence element accessory protein TnpB [Pseudomonas edaphica]NWC48930.1 IS66 family insertion sequence element accessory protein TnpB [Pseudomonas sp. IPO3747]NWE06426.1 IS66 family insertion sequence element accessory protein TnpB [Pseudomonas edaphica]NWE83263.1 IS66 family insertion sequence element accessory protein TnpB [Pseudomonas edaphica]